MNNYCNTTIIIKFILLHYITRTWIFQGTLAATKHAGAFVRGDDVIHKLFTEFAYRYR